jgi:hypothetical protein
LRTPPSTLCLRHDIVAMGAGKTLEYPTYRGVLSEH